MTFTLVEKSLVCPDCSESFTVSVDEQLFYAERGSRMPARCPECRASRRAERNAEAIRACESAPSPSLSEGFGGFGASTGATRSRGARAGGPVMHTAVCSACGATTSVPFEPRGRRPVYCRNCFNARRGR